MNIDSLTIGEMKELARMFPHTTPQPIHGAVGKKCVVRTYASGVHFGEVVSVASNEGRSRCELKNSRRLYNWKGAFTLSAVAKDGIDLSGSRISCVSDKIFIEDAIEFIPMSEKSIAQLEGAKAHEI